MKLIFLFLCLSLSAFAIPSKDFQFQMSLENVIKNSTMPDVYPGMVVASPSRENPNYYFDWVRDTALTMRALIDYWEMTQDPYMKKIILTWIESETQRQRRRALGGLGEPKYNIDGSPYTGPWGRPQNDGPALRAISMIKFARILIDQNQREFVLKRIYSSDFPATSPLKIDLEYTAQKWREPNFDPWEEEMGMHFYNLLIQYTALKEGSVLALEMGDYGASAFYQEQSGEIKEYILEHFLDAKIGIIVSKFLTRPLGYKKSGIDVAPLLAINHTWPYQDLIDFNHPNLKLYIETLVSTFHALYPVNKSFSQLGVAIGRYPEDKYNGYETSGVGNPWFLTTLALGEFYCLAHNQYLTEKAAKQFDRALFHSDRQGRFDEQFHLASGLMQGARELTWSHGAFLTAMMRCRLAKI